MFERYTEKARRVIFFARYEASQFGSPYIETEHLLLGLLREDKALTNRFLRSHASVESIRKQIEAHTTIREKVSTSVDLPLSNECKRVLAYAVPGDYHPQPGGSVLPCDQTASFYLTQKLRGLLLFPCRRPVLNSDFGPFGETLPKWPVFRPPAAKPAYNARPDPDCA